VLGRLSLLLLGALRARGGRPEIAQPFECLCRILRCQKKIAGARQIYGGTLKSQRLSPHPQGLTDVEAV